VRPNGSHVLKSVVHCDFADEEDEAEDAELVLCIKVSLAACPATANNLFDMDQAVEIAKYLSFDSAASLHAPVHVSFLTPRDGEVLSCSVLQRADLPSCEMRCTNWVYHLEDEVLEHEGARELARKMLAMHLCALGNSCDPAKGTAQWTWEHPRPVLKIVGIYSLLSAKEVIQAVSIFMR
jgi:hypothetical protein